MEKIKCVCDVCGKVIYKNPTDQEPGRVVKYWNGVIGKFENNRKTQTQSYDLCSVDCCLAFANCQDTNLGNPFVEYYFEVVPIKVLGVVEEA